MPSLLETVNWGKNALTFLDQPLKGINTDKPAIIYLRHSEADYSQVESPRDGTLTEEGLQTSLEFGERLPKTFSYRIFHSEYPRARITAEKIHQGLLNQNADSQIAGSQSYLMFTKSNDAKLSHYFNKQYRTEFLTHWISERLSPKNVEPSLELAKESAKQVTHNLREAKPGSIDLYVNHDIIILPIMFHWFGVYHAYPWAGHLDGFILQLYEDKMVFIDKEGEHAVDYPYWWTFNP